MKGLATEELKEFSQNQINNYLNHCQTSTLQMAKQMISYFETLPDPENLKMSMKQYLSTKVLVVPCKRRLVPEIEELYKYVSLDMLELIGKSFEVPIFQNQPAFDFQHVNSYPIEESYLDWKTAAWLLNRIDEIGREVLLSHNAAIYEIGMFRDLKYKMIEVAQELKTKHEGKIICEKFKLLIHAVAIGRMERLIEAEEMDWNLKYNRLYIQPLSQRASRKAVILNYA